MRGLKKEHGCEPKGWRYIGFYERNPHHRKALVLPLFRLSPLSPLLPFPLPPYILLLLPQPPPLVLAFLVLSPSRACLTDGLSRADGISLLQSEFQYIGMRPKW